MNRERVLQAQFMAASATPSLPDEAVLRLDELYVGRALERGRQRFPWPPRVADGAKPIF
jgi:hypothetical protein